MATRPMTNRNGDEWFGGGDDWLTLSIVNSARGVGILCAEEA